MITTAHRISPKFWFALVALVLAVLAAAGWFHFHGAHATHHHDAHGTSALSLNEGRRWETDLPLRTGMQRIRDAVEPVLQARATGPITRDAAKTLAASIQENVNYLIENCKLAPQADATLHVLITELLTAAALLAENPGSLDAVSQLRDALKKYPEYFDHPGWKPLAAS
jgi:hypothetical protein